MVVGPRLALIFGFVFFQAAIALGGPDCGTSGTDQEQLADCAAKYPNDHLKCEIETEDICESREHRSRVSIPCSQTDEYLDKGHIVTENQLVTVKNDVRQTLSTILRGDVSKRPRFAPSSRPKTPVNACGLSGTVEERAAHCAAQAKAEGVQSNACFLKTTPVQHDRTDKLIDCSLVEKCKSNGFRTAEWTLISKKNSNEMTWRDESTGALWGPLIPEVGSIFKAFNHCEHSATLVSISPTIMRSFDVPNCGDFWVAMNSGLNHLFMWNRTLNKDRLINGKTWCTGSDQLTYYDVTSMSVKVFRAPHDPFANFSAMCTTGWAQKDLSL